MINKTKFKFIMLRPLSSLPIPGVAQVRLRDLGFIFYEDVFEDKGCNVEGKKLLSQLGLDEKVFAALTDVPPTKSALDIWQEECRSPHIVTFCKAVDDMLDGGIVVGEVTEFCGAPGSGKTQISLQVCVDVQIPKSFGGLGGKALFIDTSSGFIFDRVREIAEACVDHCQLVASHRDEEEMNQEINNFTVDTILKGIHYVATHDYVQLLAAIFNMNDFLQNNQKVKLVVVDSLTFPFRNGTLNSLMRTRLLCNVLEELRIIALRYKVAVLMTNQLTTKISPGCTSHLVPALGDSLGHHSNQRIMLGNLQHDCHAAVLFKSPKRQQLSSKFQILKNGIRDQSSLV